MNIGDGNLAWKCFSISSYVCEIWCNAGSLLQLMEWLVSITW
jgi:hypothetical protein